jgi:hypothetical protein
MPFLLFVFFYMEHINSLTVAFVFIQMLTISAYIYFQIFNANTMETVSKRNIFLIRTILLITITGKIYVITIQINNNILVKYDKLID